MKAEHLKIRDEAFAKYHEERRLKIVKYVESQVAKHIKSGGNDTQSYRIDQAIDYLRVEDEKTLWNAAWEAASNTK